MRCSDCNKFVSLDFSDPEVESLEVSGSEVTATVRIERTCAECGEPMKEASLEMSATIPDFVEADHSEDDHELEVEEKSLEQIEEGGGRWKKSYFGAKLTAEVKCGCGETWTVELEDKVQASGMEEMC